MEFIKRIRSFLDVEKQFDVKFGVTVEHTFTIAGQEDSIEHGLKKVPIGIREYYKDSPGVVYWTKDADMTYVYLACTISPTVVRMEIF